MDQYTVAPSEINQNVDPESADVTDIIMRDIPGLLGNQVASTYHHFGDIDPNSDGTEDNWSSYPAPVKRPSAAARFIPKHHKGLVEIRQGIKSIRIAAVSDRLQSTESTIEKLLEMIDQLQESSGNPNWDHEGADPVLPDTCDVARRFAKLLPFYDTIPEVHATAFGEINFSWSIDRDKRFSVGIGSPPKHDIAFALLAGNARWNGSEPWDGQLPTVIRCCLERLGQ